MGSHPLNLTLRFILELCALIAVGTWGWKQSDSFLKFILAFGLPILLAAIWGTFATPDDPSRSGKTVIATAGIIRFIIELAFFAIATFALYNQGMPKLSYVFAFIVTLHYIASYDRIIWLLEN